MKLGMILPTVMAMGIGFTAIGVSTAPARADSTQQKKNTWRNIAIGAGVIATHGLIRGNGLETVVGVGGAAYAGSRYEQERKAQARRQRERAYYHRSARYRKYYWYNGHEYYMNRHTGNRVLVS